MSGNTFDHGPHGLLIVDPAVDGEPRDVSLAPEAVMRLHAEVVRVGDARVLARAVDGVEATRLRTFIHCLKCYRHFSGFR